MISLGISNFVDKKFSFSFGYEKIQINLHTWGDLIKMAALGRFCEFNFQYLMRKKCFFKKNRTHVP
jgi:hypothetical protein